ncbi:MAG: hypothetical protein COT15_04515 [Candidatus Diapherotrites archaeon CG08_land_8_20_14_0_20_34_12]|nr:MAG: hypothetical protein COT15_04515 [Candidatus Diapherotrites archaeon CG08_land_8_20_14_0_20_34_12]
MNIRVTDYTSRVLGVVKEKYGLRDKGEALDKFAELCGEDFVDKEVREDVIKDVIDSCEKHVKKYGFRKMNTKELDKLCGV